MQAEERKEMIDVEDKITKTITNRAYRSEATHKHSTFEAEEA